MGVAHLPIYEAGFEDEFTGIGAGTNAEFTLAREGNLIVLTRKLDSSNNEQSDFKIKAKDGLGGGALGVVYKEVGAITDLPLFAKNGFRVKVRGDGDLTADDYYVEFKTDDENQDIGPGSSLIMPPQACLCSSLTRALTSSNWSTLGRHRGA